MMPTFSTFVQHNNGSHSFNQATERSKGNPNWQGGSQIVFFSDDKILYTENSNNSTKMLLELIIKSIKVEDKVNEQNK